MVSGERLNVADLTGFFLDVGSVARCVGWGLGRGPVGLVSSVHKCEGTGLKGGDKKGVVFNQSGALCRMKWLNPKVHASRVGGGQGLFADVMGRG